MLNQLPESDNKEKIRQYLLEIAEDKYQELIQSGMDIDEVHSGVLESICSLEDIRDILGVDENEKKNNILKKDYGKRLGVYILAFIMFPFLFLTIQGAVKSERISNMVFLLTSIGMLYCACKFLSFIKKREKVKRSIESKVGMQLRKVRNIILGLAGSGIIICAIVDVAGIIVIGIICIAVISYLLAKMLIK